MKWRRSDLRKIFPLIRFPPVEPTVPAVTLAEPETPDGGGQAVTIGGDTRRPVQWDERLREWRYLDDGSRVPQMYRSPLDGVTEIRETPGECAAAEAMRPERARRKS